MKSILNGPKEEDKPIPIEEEEEDISVSILNLPHWVFSPGDGRLYLMIVKPKDSQLQISLNEKGDRILFFLSYGNIDSMKKIISDVLKIHEDFLHTHIDIYSQESCVPLDQILKNQPNVHMKSDTQVLISWPISEHEKFVESLIF